MKFKGQTFKDQTIRLDFLEFENCKFEKCLLIYGGYGTVTFVGCGFSNVKWELDNAAKNAITFLSGLYHGMGEGGPAMVEELFNSIKRGDFSSQD